MTPSKEKPMKPKRKEENIIVCRECGEEFNPELMEAIEIIEGPKNKVMEVSRKGYLLEGKVLRIAKVKVGGVKVKEN